MDIPIDLLQLGSFSPRTIQGERFWRRRHRRESSAAGPRMFPARNPNRTSREFRRGSHHQLRDRCLAPGQLGGILVDSSGAVIANAEVNVNQAELGIVRKAITDSAGTLDGPPIYLPASSGLRLGSRVQTGSWPIDLRRAAGPHRSNYALSVRHSCGICGGYERLPISATCQRSARSAQDRGNSTERRLNKRSELAATHLRCAAGSHRCAKSRQIVSLSSGRWFSRRNK